LVFKILFKMVDVSAPQFFTRASSSYYTRERHKLVLNYSQVDVRKYFSVSGLLNNGTARPGQAVQPHDFDSLG